MLHFGLDETEVRTGEDSKAPGAINTKLLWTCGYEVLVYQQISYVPREKPKHAKNKCLLIIRQNSRFVCFELCRNKQNITRRSVLNRRDPTHDTTAVGYGCSSDLLKRLNNPAQNMHVKRLNPNTKYVVCRARKIKHSNQPPNLLHTIE